MAFTATGEKSAIPAGQSAFGSGAWNAASLWVVVGALAALYVLNDPAPIDAFDAIAGAAVGIAWPAYEATKDRSQVWLRQLPAAPAELEHKHSGPSISGLLTGILIIGALLAAGTLWLPQEYLGEGAAAVLGAIVLALAGTARACQLGLWERRHPGRRLVRVSTKEDSWIAVQTEPAWSEAQAAFGAGPSTVMLSDPAAGIGLRAAGARVAAERALGR